MSFGSPQAVDRMFPDTATLEVDSPSFDEEGTEVHAFSSIGTCAVQLSPAGADSELRTADASVERRVFRAILHGWFPEMDESSRIVIGGRVFGVIGREDYSYGMTLGADGWTVLTVEEFDEEGSS